MRVDTVLSVLAPFGDTVAQASSGDDTAGTIGACFAILIWLGICAAVVVFMTKNRQPFQLESQTSAPPDEAMRRAVQAYTMAGWQVNSQLQNNVTFIRQNKPSCLILILLFCLGFIPGLIYLVIGGRAISANLHVDTSGPASSRVRIDGNARGFGGLATAERAM